MSTLHSSAELRSTQGYDVDPATEVQYDDDLLDSVRRDRELEDSASHTVQTHPTAERPPPRAYRPQPHPRTALEPVPAHVVNRSITPLEDRVEAPPIRSGLPTGAITVGLCALAFAAGSMASASLLALVTMVVVLTAS